MLAHTAYRHVAGFVLLAACALTMNASGQGYICAEGGGNPGKGNWAEEVFGWMVEKGAKGGVVIIGAVPIENDERPALFTRLGASSVTSLVVTQENADSPDVEETIRNASIVFIRGGDQSRYVNWWTGTKTQKAIKSVYEKGGVIAGTSAGCAVLGEITYDARHGGLSPNDILHDARHPDLTLTADFLGFSPGILYDTHFTERGRLPRLAAMLAACALDLKREIVGLGVDPRTAVCVDPNGMAEIRGEGTVTMLRITDSTVAELEPGSPPSVVGLAYSQWPAGYVVDLNSKTVLKRPEFVKHVLSEQWPRAFGEATPMRIDGGSAGDPIRYQSNVCIISRVWTGKAVSDAMHAGQMWVSSVPGAQAFYLDEGAALTVEKDFKVLVACTGEKPRSVVLLRGAGMQWAGISPTEKPAIEEATLDIVQACAPDKPESKP